MATTPSQEKSGENSSSPGAAEVPTIDVHKAKSLIESGHVYLDVRMEDDFRAAHADAEKVWKQRSQLADEPVAMAADDVQKIYNVPYYVHAPQGGRVKNPEFLEKVNKIFKEDDHLVVGCGTGGRSLPATADLVSAGMTHVYNMGGGYRAWEKNGFPVKKQQKEQNI